MTASEITKVAQVVGDRLSNGKATNKVLIPLKGWSSLEREGDPFYNSELCYLLVNELEKGTQVSKVEVKEIDAHIEDELFAREVARSVMEVVPSLS